MRVCPDIQIRMKDQDTISLETSNTDEECCIKVLSSQLKGLKIYGTYSWNMGMKMCMNIGMNLGMNMSMNTCSFPHPIRPELRLPIQAMARYGCGPVDEHFS